MRTGARVPTRGFLTKLFHPCDGGLVELRALPSGRRQFVEIGAWSELAGFITAEIRLRQSIAVGIATRRNDTSGDVGNCRELAAVWADLDASPAAATKTLETFVFKPSTIVSSGAGLHAYWRLREPVNLQGADTHLASSVLRRLAGRLGGDDRATDVSRVLRLPGSYSFKYGTPQLVTIVSDEDRTVDIAELDDILPTEIARRGELVLNDFIENGCRNDTLFCFARSLKWHQVSLPRLARYVHEQNVERCRVPLDEPEVDRLVKSAWVLPFRTQAPAMPFRTDLPRVMPGDDPLDPWLKARLEQKGNALAATLADELHVSRDRVTARLQALAVRGEVQLGRHGRQRVWQRTRPRLWENDSTTARDGTGTGTGTSTDSDGTADTFALTGSNYNAPRRDG